MEISETAPILVKIEKHEQYCIMRRQKQLGPPLEWKILQVTGILDHLPPEKPGCRSEATVRMGCGTTHWFQIGKGVCPGCILSPCLFNLYAEYIMRNAGLNETQAGIKIAGRNINNLRYADDTTLMAESEEALKSLLMKVKEESKKKLA